MTGPGMSARLREVAALFLRLGVTAFGGPAAHIAMITGFTPYSSQVAWGSVPYAA